MTKESLIETLELAKRRYAGTSYGNGLGYALTLVREHDAAMGVVGGTETSNGQGGNVTPSSHDDAAPTPTTSRPFTPADDPALKGCEISVVGNGLVRKIEALKSPFDDSYVVRKDVLEIVHKHIAASVIDTRCSDCPCRFGIHCKDHKEPDLALGSIENAWIYFRGKLRDNGKRTSSHDYAAFKEAVRMATPVPKPVMVSLEECAAAMSEAHDMEIADCRIILKNTFEAAGVKYE